jgi:SAM-dependent methyltransferase
LSEVHPRRVLEVGSGKGNLALRVAEEIGCELIGLDSSAAMVSASSALGILTIKGDIRDLPFPDASFDAVVAAWMLYHVSPLEQGLSELARVLRPGGRLVAITNGKAHLEELWTAVGADREEPPFSVENGANHLGKFFSSIEQHETDTHALFPDRETAASYLRSVDRSKLANLLPHSGWPLRVQGVTAVFVAQKPT